MQKPVMRRVTDPNDPAMPDVQSIYESQFPASERKPVMWLQKIMDRADYTVLIAEDQQTAIGFAILFTPVNPADAALLEYLAIDPAHHGRGIGSLLVQGMINTQPMLVEIEAGDEPHAIRRRDFYRRLGFRRLIGLPYLLPLPNPPPMEVMLINSPAEFDRQIFLHWLTNIYAHVYGCDENDSRLQKMFEFLPPRMVPE